MPKKVVNSGIYLAGGDSFCSVLEEVNSFICSKLQKGHLKTDDACILGKLAMERHRNKIDGHLLGLDRTDQDQFVSDVANWTAKRFYGESAYAMYSIERRSWEIWE
jgi:hypothetical protein